MNFGGRFSMNAWTASACSGDAQHLRINSCSSAWTAASSAVLRAERVLRHEKLGCRVDGIGAGDRDRFGDDVVGDSVSKTDSCRLLA